MKGLILTALLTLSIYSISNACLNDECHVANQETCNVNNTEGKVYNPAMVDRLPEFPGGYAEMYKWIAEHMIYPAKAIEDGIQGRVIIDFVISKNGDAENVKVLRRNHPELDKEAVRLIKSMPKWKPGQINGENVNVSYTLPVTFKLPQ